MGSAGMKLSHSPEIVEGFGKYGYSESVILPLGIVELSCVILYAIPQTAVLGAILATGYLGGAVATHVAADEPFVAPIVFGILLWSGLGLRDARLRALLPLRKL
jgi:hypothetical protein